VAVLGIILRCFDGDVIATVLANGQGCSPHLVFGVLPAGEALPLRTKVSAPAGSGLVTCFLNTVPMSPYPFLLRAGRHSKFKYARSLSAVRSVRSRSPAMNRCRTGWAMPPPPGAAGPGLAPVSTAG